MGIRYIEALTGIFLSLMQTKPREFYTTALLIAMTILEVDQKIGGKDHSKGLIELKYIMENTHKDLKIPLALAEAYVDSTRIEKWGAEREIKDNKGNLVKIKGRPVSVLDIYQRMKESYLPILREVSDVVKDYSLDMRFRIGEGGSSMGWLKEEQEGET